MSIRVVCPQCSKAIKAPDRQAGQSAKCPACGGPIQIPLSDVGDDFDDLVGAAVADKPAPTTRADQRNRDDFEALTHELRTANHHLAEISSGSNRIAYWVKFWSVSYLISVALGLLVFILAAMRMLPNG